MGLWCTPSANFMSNNALDSAFFALAGSSDLSATPEYMWENFGLGLGFLGSDADLIAYNAKSIAGGSALGTAFWTSVGEGISRYSTWASIAVDGGQAFASSDLVGQVNHGVDAFFDYGISKLGPPGGAIGILWGLSGGMAGWEKNPAVLSEQWFGGMPDD